VQQTSSDNPNAIAVQVQNTLGKGLKLYWDNAGEESFFADVEPNGDLPVSTFHGHRWVVRTAKGKKVRKFLVDKKNGQEQTIVIEKRNKRNDNKNSNESKEGAAGHKEL
jgi:hypothetical protein